MGRASTRTPSKERMRLLEEENASLRAALELEDTITEETWELLPEHIRAEMVVRALFEEEGNIVNVAIRLGFIRRVTRVDGHIHLNVGRAERERISSYLLTTPGVSELMSRDCSDAEANRQQVIERLQQIAVTGKADAAVRASTALAKIRGWNSGPDTVIDNRRVTLVHLMGNEGKGTVTQEALEGTVDAMSFLDHEPAVEGGIIDSGDKAIYEALKS
jgi:hypothetical protein